MPEYTWTGRPPAGSTLDTTSPYYTNLVAAYLFNDAVSGDANGTTTKNLVTNTLTALAKTAYDSLTWSASGLVLGGNAHNGIALTPTAVGGNGLPCTVVILHKPNFTTPSFPVQLVTIGSGTGSGTHGNLTLESATTIGISSYGTAPYVATVPDITGTTAVTAVNSSSTGNTLYQNGTNVGATSGNVFIADGSFAFGSGGSGGGGFTGTVEAVYVYVGRQLTGTEHAHLAAAPYAPIIPVSGSVSTAPTSSLVSVKVTNPRGCLPGETEVAYLDISTVNGATDADSLPTVTVSLLNQAAMTAAAPSITHIVTGLYRITVPTPSGSTWCDDICVIGAVVVGGKTFNWVVEFSLPTVATDAAGGVILQPSEHINEIPLDIVSALSQYSLTEYVDPANPATSALRLSSASLSNTPQSGGLTPNQVLELNSILDGINRAVTPAAAAAAALTAIKTDSQFFDLLNRQKQRFSYVSATKSYQLLLDDGVTVFGPPISLSVDASNIVTGR